MCCDSAWASAIRHRGEVTRGVLTSFTTDPDTARSFYEHLFAWTSESAGDEYGGYVNFSYRGEMVAGCMRNDGTDARTFGVRDSWTVYLAVENA